MVILSQDKVKLIDMTGMELKIGKWIDQYELTCRPNAEVNYKLRGEVMGVYKSRERACAVMKDILVNLALRNAYELPQDEDEYFEDE